MNVENDRKIFAIIQQTATHGLVDMVFEKKSGQYYYSHAFTEGQKRCTKTIYESALELHNCQVENGILERYKKSFGLSDDACRYVQPDE